MGAARREQNFAHRLAAGRRRVVLSPGDWHATGADVVLETLLGSCIAACLFDPVAKVGGMNHFALPTHGRPEDLLVGDAGRYGALAMELLVNGLLKAGARRPRLVAKVFGGGHVLATAHHERSVPRSNVRFVEEYLAAERITIAGRDLGGTCARRVLFTPVTGEAWVERLKSSTAVEREERKLVKKVEAASTHGGELTLFDDEGQR